MEDECNYFSYDSAKGYCVLFHYFDLLFCTSVSGTAESEISECTPEAGSHTCDDFVDIECSYPGEVLVTQPNFLYPVECQNVLITLGNINWHNGELCSNGLFVFVQEMPLELNTSTLTEML